MEEEEDLKVCQNCQEKFPSFKIDLHQAYCRRNIKRCQLCSKMVDINEQENHHNQFHAEKPCQYCEQLFPVTQLAHHTQTCEERPIECKHCQNPFPFSAIPRHEDQCGSRTRRCETCRKYIKIREYQAHFATCQFLEAPRNESSENRRVPHQISHQRQRMNSNEKIKKEHTKDQFPFQVPRPNKKNVVIERQTFTQLVDPVPISIRLAMQRDKEKGRHK